MYNIQELAQQIVDTKNQIETEIKTIRSARENLDNIQNMAQTLANGFQDLQGSMKNYLDQNNSLVRDTSREQLATIDEKFGDSFSQMQDTQRQITEFVENNSEMITAVNKLNGELPRLNLADKFSEMNENFHNQVQELHSALNVIETANRENSKKLNNLAQENQKLTELLQKEIRSIGTASAQTVQDMNQEFKNLNTSMEKQSKFSKLELTIISKNSDKILENQRGQTLATTSFFETAQKSMEQVQSSTNNIIWVLVLNVITILLLLFR